MGSDAGRREPRKRYACRASLSGEPVSAGRETWRSKSGETLTPVPLPFDPEAIEPGDRSVWRYRAMFPLDLAPICLGEGGTPMIEASLVGLPVHFKVDYQQPSGSYKDRGSALVAAALVDTPARAAVIDSSGNAGASMAAYLARTNLPLKLFAPRDTPESKLRQAAAHGAEIDRSAETRLEAARLAQAAAGKGTAYASHVYHPLFLVGQMTMAWEIWEDLDRTLPDIVIVPVGNGLIVLGLHHGFKALVTAGLAERLPRIYGVQASACAPIFDAFQRGADQVGEAASRPTLAGGLRVEAPPRGSQALAAVRESGGAMLTVSEAEIRRGQALAANLGWYVEPSSAVGLAGLVKLDKVIETGSRVVLPLTGSGLKS
ncbi:MAG: pyridoxal-phosphate dependent enzyme [Caldilineae bacterium]|nr:pyridoxal-phosphate dependent enzyme [Chloroflexota bacterium]MCB9175617.1 pyridoxal-phosphate dependent enzyme [Caldilineae bacterium]